MSKRPELVQFGDLLREHFDAAPVWASCHSFDSDEDWFDDTDEETFRPWLGPVPVDPAEGTFLVRCLITLADGTEVQGFLTPQAGPDPSDLGTIQPHIFLPDGTVFGFWFGMMGQSIERDGKSFYRALNKSGMDVFPAHFVVEQGLSSGLHLSGEIAGFYWTPDLGVVKVET